MCSLALIATVSGLGCAHADSAADRHIAEMREAVGKLQADRDQTDQRSDRDLPLPDETTARAPKAPASVFHPRIVQLGEADRAADESDDPNDPNARPEIRLYGSGGPPGRSLRGKTAREMRVEPADEARTDDGSRPSIMDPEAKRIYESALSLVNSKQYERALESFSVFVARWPDHPYVENALYWRGEAYFARGEFLRAAEQFEAVLARFGGGRKGPDALLKIGMCHDRLGAPERAKQAWDRLRRDFPRSDAATKIPQSEGDSRNRGVGPKESR